MSTLSFNDVTALWKADKRRWVKPSTYAVYVQITNKHILPFFSSIKPEELSEESIQRFADGLKVQGLSIHSIRDALMILKMILRFGEKLSAWPNIIYDIHFPMTAMRNTNIPVLTTSDQPGSGINAGCFAATEQGVDKDWYSSMWIAYPLYSDTYSGSNKYSGSWAAAQGISSSYQISIWTNSYNVYLGATEYSDSFSTSGNEYYARGHQIPDADRQYKQTMVQQTYYAINSTPQIQNKFNGGIWQQLEQAVRTQAATTDTLYVATGPVFQTAGGSESVTWILPKADTKRAPVPNYYWKVLLKVERDGSGNVTDACTIGFWFEHKQQLAVVPELLINN